MKKFLKIALAVLLVFLLVAAGYVYKLLDSIQNTQVVNPDTGKPIKDPSDLGIGPSAPDFDKTGIKNIMLFGTDNRSRNEKSRSDTMMVASIDRKHKAVKITSLMRDMYVPIPGRNDDRLNTAYAFGGPSLAIKTVNSTFNMDITDYVSVDFYSLEMIIDEVGGIPIDVKRSEVKEINKYAKDLDRVVNDGSKAPLLTEAGLQVLSGRQAVSYCRIRSVGRDDFERTERQRRVLNELFKKGKSIGITRIPGLVSKILPEIETSLTKTEIVDLAMVMLGFSTSEIDQFRLPADGYYTDQTIRRMRVLVPDLDESKDMLHDFIYGTDQEEVGNNNQGDETSF
ncbi:MAG TPA: LCP family protein [Bacillota bacterium]|nr:LCP family protein [Bacillota bacterium]